MPNPPTRRFATAALLVLVALALLRAGTGAQERVTVTLLATTDVHGHVYPHDYFTGKPAPRGLAAAASLVAQVRAGAPHTLLVDCGDTIQGAPLEGVHQVAVRSGATSAPDPMMLAMNAMRYDAMVVGNHEFNFGLGNVEAARRAARFPWLSANTETGDAIAPFAPFLIKTVGGVKVAVIGVTPPTIPEWEKADQIRGLSWLSPEDGVRRALKRLETEAPDVIVAAVHGGLDRDPETGGVRPGQSPGENPVWQIAERFPQIAAIVYGHTHGREPGRRVGSTLIVQPRAWAQEVARLDFTLAREGGRWRLESTESALLPVTAATPADAEILRIAAPYHEAAERYLDQPVTEAPADLDGARGRFEDTPLVDAIHAVQLHFARADVSFASLFDPQVRIPRGPVSVRQLAALYIYDNELYALEGTGRMVREALENAARYFTSCGDPACETGPSIDASVFGFNFDTAQGVEYEIDLREPVGRRVKNLRYRGAPLADDQPLRLAVNNYRAGGSAGYDTFRGATIAWRSGREIRDLMADYYREGRQLPTRADGNWRIVPPRAAEALTTR